MTASESHGAYLPGVVECVEQSSVRVADPESEERLRAAIEDVKKRHDTFLEKFGGDNVVEIRCNLDSFVASLQ